jgi:hypothetical protein
MFKKRVYGSVYQKRGHKYQMKQNALKAFAILYGFVCAYSFTFGLEVAAVVVLAPTLVYLIFFGD